MERRKTGEALVGSPGRIDDRIPARVAFDEGLISGVADYAAAGRTAEQRGARHAGNFGDRRFHRRFPL
jgi:hypothetical protein